MQYKGEEKSNVENFQTKQVSINFCFHCQLLFLLQQQIEQIEFIRNSELSILLIASEGVIFGIIINSYFQYSIGLQQLFQMHLDRKQAGFSYLDGKAFEQNIKYLNTDSSEGAQKLIESIKRLDPQPTSLRSVKKLLLKYGLPIMIYLKPFYEKFPLEFAKENKDNFKLLAGIARQLTQRKKINQINFMFQQGQISYTKQIEVTEEQRNYIGFISWLSDLNELVIKESSMNYSDYCQKIETMRKKRAFSNIELKAIPEFCLNKNSFPALAAKSDEKQVEDSWNSSYYQQESFGDFYLHQQGSVSKSWENEIKEISYSLNTSSQSNVRTHLCCRKYFLEDQVIEYNQDIRTAFFQQSFPYSELVSLNLKKTMCSFLNCEGGKIYIGIEKNKSGKNQIRTEIYTESQKEQILKWFRRIAEGIEPDIVTKKLYNVEFVPIRQRTGYYIPGGNVIKVSVDYGIRDEVYSYNLDGYDCFPFRNDIQIIEKQGRQLLKFYRNVVKTPLSPPEPLHSYPCEKPDIGQPVHSNFKAAEWKNNKKKYMPVHSDFNSTTDASQQRQESLATKGVQIHSHSMSLSNKHFIAPKKGEMSFKAGQAHRNEHSQKFVYFFVVGLDEKHLTPIFVQKNLSANVKIQSTTQRRLVVRVHGENQIEKVRKILKKIQSKYKEKKLKVYQMSLELEIEEKFDEALNFVKNNKLIHKVSGENRLKFKLFRDSFRAFLELESHKIPVRFLLHNSEQKNPNQS